jgi:FkbM family methyltransferase
MKKLLKRIYHLIPFKKPLFLLIRPIRLPQKIYQHLYFKGVFTVPVNTSSFKIYHNGYPIENELFWAGFKRWEARSLQLWADLAAKSNTILDVGANTGVYSLLAGAVNPEASIFAFEPLRTVYSQLKQNVSINKFIIKPFEIAMSNQNGEMSFFADKEFSYSGSLNRNHDLENTMELKVKSETLDHFISRMKIAPDLVKIDVERHEPEVLEGFMGHINKHHPTMLIEVLDENIGEKIRELLKGSGYIYFSINDKTQEMKRMDQMGKSEDFNVLVITEEKAASVGL